MNNEARPTARRISARAGLIVAVLVAFSPASATPHETPPAYAAPRSAVHEISAGERTYSLYVSLPPGYGAAENADRRYPVVYLNDGDLFFMTAAGAPLLSYYNGLLEETILVGVSYAAGENPLASRQRDFTPAMSDAIAGESGGAGAFLAMIETSVIPMIERTYRADPERRALAGHSFGALFGVYVLLTKPQLFADYILVSPSLWYADHWIAGLEARYADAHDDLAARVYFAVGDLEGPKGGLKALDMVNDQIAFAARLRSRAYAGLTLKDEILDDGVNHATAFPVAYLRALEWLFPTR